VGASLRDISKAYGFYFDLPKPKSIFNWESALPEFFSSLKMKGIA